MAIHPVAVSPVLLVLSLLSSATAQAALVGRMADDDGRYQAVYDSDLDITWLADANYAATSGFDADGLMKWTNVQDWIATLNRVSHLGAADWRLPLSDGCSGYDCTGSELGHLFYTEFGGVAGYGEPMPPLADADLALFSGIPVGGFWSATEYSPDAAWVFEFGAYDVGRQIYFPKDVKFHAWAVRSGDIGGGVPVATDALVVPVPSALGLFASGLIGIVGLARRKPA